MLLLTWGQTRVRQPAVCVCVCGGGRTGNPDGYFLLTSSTSEKTRIRLSASKPLTSVSVQFLLRSSAIRSGYLETSSNPTGSLGQEQEEWALQMGQSPDP